ncbi:MAG: hypothetical protein QMD53_06995 [Actinomycetota bacterium]|nr:hypothetical protein [Actinomycetota bacterium]
MKILLVKRLESSFYAFKNTIGRFIHSYEQFLGEFDKGKVYVSKKYAGKIFDLLENDDEEVIQRLLDDDKAKVYEAKDFKEEFAAHLKSDLPLLRGIYKQWSNIERDPKMGAFLAELSANPILKRYKIIIFTESKETAEHLFSHLQEKFSGQTLLFTGSSSTLVREQVIENFDAPERVLPKTTSASL